MVLVFQIFWFNLTGANTLILMTKEFDPIIETPMHPQEFGERKLKLHESHSFLVQFLLCQWKCL